MFGRRTTPPPKFGVQAEVMTTASLPVWASPIRPQAQQN